MSTRRARFVVLLSAALLLALGLWVFRHRIEATLSGERAIAGPDYLGSEACAECHRAESEAWQGSHHALAMQPATGETVLGDFESAVFVHRGDTTRFFRRDGRFWVRTAGEDGSIADFPVVHTFGVEPLQQYLVPLSRGRLQALTVAWDARPLAQGGQRWFSLYPDERILPGDPLHWTGRDQNWNYMCAECHVTDLRRGYDERSDSYRTHAAEARVGCEGCHGPGEAHVRWARTGGRAEADTALGLLVRFRSRRSGGWSFEPDADIARRERPLAAREELLACAACHSRRRVIREGRLPGEPLHDTHVPEVLEEELYFADGGIRGEVYEYGSFLQSKMFHAGVTCGDCHEPHALRLRAEGNALCGQCHRPARYDGPEHHFHAAGSEAALCVSCHMPSRTYMGVDDRRDHAFRVPHPEVSGETGAPNACTECHGDRSPEWAAREIARRRAPETVPAHAYAAGLHAGRTERPDGIPLLVGLAGDQSLPGIVRATALRLLSAHPLPVVRETLVRELASPDPAVRLEAVSGAAALEPELRLSVLSPLLEDGLRAVRVAAARALASVPRERFGERSRSSFETAIAECEASERVNVERPEAHLNLGNLFRDLGRPGDAEREFRRALALDSTFVPAALNLADLWREQGRDVRADSLLSEVLVGVPESADALFARGLARVRLRRGEEALADLRLASGLRRDDVRLQTVYALALHGAGETDAALLVLGEAIARRPGNPGLLYLLATLHRDLGRRREAESYARALLRLDGANPAALALVRELSPPEP